LLPYYSFWGVNSFFEGAMSVPEFGLTVCLLLKRINHFFVISFVQSKKVIIFARLLKLRIKN
jgi:hypothetical protein